jgi:acetyl-CoA carboxylase carboxyl transferase subunit beta
MAYVGPQNEEPHGGVGPLDARSVARLKEIPHDLMTKCTSCGHMLVTKDWLRDLKVCSRCGHHARLGAPERIELLTDEDSFEEWDANLAPRDPLHFPGYENKIAVGQLKTRQRDSFMSGAATLAGRPIAIGACEFGFMGGSMGSVFGERLTRLLERAATEKRPAIVVTSSGGARMHESLLSLMQMAKSSAAVARLKKAKVPYITLLTDPSTGGVQASFASLGDFLLAEPGAYIGFTGRVVIEQNLKIKLPEGFQSSEFQMAHGQLDLIVPRAKLKETIGQLLGLLLN